MREHEVLVDLDAETESLRITALLADPAGARSRVRAGTAIAAQAGWQRGGQALCRLLLSVATSVQ